MTGMGDGAQITLTAGAIRGVTEAGVRRFLGIPYAQPPFGANRFRLPQPTQWSGIKDATSFGATAPQSPYPAPLSTLLGGIEITGDDILTLNVWTPEDAEGAPVVVWIHGGAFERGTAALPGYDGSAFARRGVVFVSVNYRLGSEGFSVLSGVPRNLGLHDVAAALTWVHREIAAFGGDPDRITLMGESAGGSLVAALLAREDTRPLVAGAIIQSAPLEARRADQAGKVTKQLAKALGVPATRKGFHDITPTQLLEARRKQAAGSSPLGGAPGFQITLDPDALPRSPHEVLPAVTVPLLIGTNTDEYRLWFAPEALDRISEVKLFAARIALRIRARAVRAYRQVWPAATTGELFGQLATDMLVRAPATRVAQQRGTATYMYEFAWESPVRDLRAAHAVELGFVFDGVRTGAWESLIGGDAPERLAREMHEAWVTFITDGDPGWAPFGSARAVRVFTEPSATLPQRRSTALDLLPVPRRVS